MNFIWVFVGGGLGSMLRYSISRFTLSSLSERWAPLAATLGSNLLACIALAFLVKAHAGGQLSNSAFVLLATGFCGGFSTFSTFSYETYAFYQRGDWMYAVLNVVISVAVGLIAMALILRNMPSAEA